MKTLTKKVEALLYWCITQCIMVPTLKKHTGAVVGMENLPENGPYILAPNHASYMDHFLLMAFYRFCFGKKLFFLTKQEAFKSWYSRLWHNCLGGIPVNREKTDVRSMKSVMNKLRHGDVVVIYPEGTRGQGLSLLPFKHGAFKIAEITGVSVVPVGIRGANKILPKGGRIFRQASAQIVFGQAISSNWIKKHGAQTAAETCSIAVGQMVYGSTILSPINTANSASVMASRAETIIEKVLEDGLDKSSQPRLKAACSLATYALATDSGNIQARIQHTRAYGLNLLAQSRWAFIWNAHYIKTAARRIADCDSNHPFANYIMGVYYLTIPRFLGGSARKAYNFLSFAYNAAAKYGLDQATFATSYAQSLIACGNNKAAEEVLFSLVSAKETSKRARRRINRAIAMLSVA